jgi:probable addiction module antidote protein
MTDQSDRPTVSPKSSPDEIANYINYALKSSDVAKIRQAIGEVTRLHNMSDLAKMAGIERTSIYRAFSSRQLPSFPTVVRILGAMGLQLKVIPRRGRRAKSHRSNSQNLNSAINLPKKTL